MNPPGEPQSAEGNSWAGKLPGAPPGGWRFALLSQSAGGRQQEEAGPVDRDLTGWDFALSAVSAATSVMDL